MFVIKFGKLAYMLQLVAPVANELPMTCIQVPGGALSGVSVMVSAWAGVTIIEIETNSVEASSRTRNRELELREANSKHATSGFVCLDYLMLHV
jgi:hypothetical protein